MKVRYLISYAEQRAMTTANVDDPGEAREVVGVQDSLKIEAVRARHSGVENACVARVSRKVVEKTLAMDPIETGVARLDGLVEITPGSPKERLAIHHSVGACRLRMIGP